MGLFRRILARRVIRRLRRAGVRDARYDAHAFAIRFRTLDGERTVLQLQPLFRRRIRRRQLDAFVAGLLRTPEVPETWAVAAPLLRPVLRGSAPGELLRRSALPFLSAFVVIDHPETMTYVTPDQLTDWKVTADEVFDAALANLTGATLHGSAAGPVVVRFVDDGNAYWTSHLLLQGWLARLQKQVGGVPVAFAPERGTLLVTADGSEHLPGLFAQAEAIWTGSARALSPCAYVSDDQGCVVPYPTPAGHPLRHLAKRAETLLKEREESAGG
ncbi:hypothetical protein ACTI_32420 [Actinoplanes sp. OR16]|uniref:hypothetical protein n=1 Tax=Actinoplanes sp. OR16 TaxID=946334 RepID=UPI000F703785|nr:hypothetical protein [Actinoplanes sp. OR16]BBH66557.1 hypothetical protein ACTI_32420 [Actinoplanes sp. OR16]